MSWNSARLHGGLRDGLHARARERHLERARDRALVGDLDAAVDALRDLQALEGELVVADDDTACDA